MAVTAVTSGFLTFVGTVFNGKVVVPRYIFDQEKASREKWEAETMRLNALIADRYAPALESSAQANARSTEALAAATLALHDAQQTRRER